MTFGGQSGATGLTPLRVLYFEDCQADIELSGRTLTSAGFDVQADVAVSCEELLAYARSSSYDVILSDYRMPHSSGIEVFEALKSAGFDTPFILVSGALGEERAVECLKIGVADYVLKDKLFRLPSAVRRALTEHRLRREREHATTRIRQLNRLYSVLSRAGQAIVRIRERVPLLAEICRILTEAGEFERAWAGLLSPENRLLPVTGLPPVQELDLDGTGAIGVALRERRSVICNGRVTDMRMETCREPAFCRECRSAGAFPLIVGGSASGALAIYSAQPGFFDDENIALLNELAADVSFALGRMDAEDSHRRATEDLDQFFALSRDMLGIASLDGNLLRVNHAWESALGYSTVDLLGKAWLTLVHPDDRASAEAAIAGLRSGADVESLELRFRSKTGSYRWLVGNATTAPGRGVLFATVRDLTESKRLEEELREKNTALADQYQRAEVATRMKSEFIANMSHELRSPLNGIIGFSELLFDGKLGALDERPREFIGRVHSSAMHLLGLINDLLDLSKIEAGRLEFRPEPVAVSQVMVEVIGSLGAVAVKKRIRIQTEIDDSANRVITDPEKLRQILHNYLSNALKFTGQNGRIFVRLKAEGSRFFRVEVADSGSGIRRQDLSRLFVEFEQLDGSRAKRYQGTGLGLALTKRLAEGQGGTVGVESEIGSGSTFFVVLPREPLEGAPEAPCVPMSAETVLP